MIAFLLTVTNCLAQRIKNIDVCFVYVYSDREDYYHVFCRPDSNFYSCNNGKVRGDVTNKYSDAILDIDKHTFEQYINNTLTDYRNKKNEPKQVSVYHYNIAVEYCDGTSGKYSFPATMYLSSKNKSPEKYKYYINNLFFLIRSYFYLF